MLLISWQQFLTPETDRRHEMTRSIFKLGLPLTLALAAASGAVVAQTKDQTSEIVGHGTSVTVGPVTDGQLKQRVQAALHSDPYFYDAHTNVSIAGGNVVLRGVVFSAWDLQDAMRIASQAAGGRRVIDDLSIVNFR
jgi:osmotically-inducible protein OsmY